jgi:hypothetical protein
MARQARCALTGAHWPTNFGLCRISHAIASGTGQAAVEGTNLHVPGYSSWENIKLAIGDTPLTFG